MAKRKTLIDKAIENLDADIAALQLARAKLLAQAAQQATKRAAPKVGG